MQKFSQNPTFRRRIVTEDIVPQAHIPTYGSTPDTTSTRSKGEDYRYAKALYGITKISHKGGFLSIPDIKSHKSLIKKGEYTLDKAKSILSNISDKIPNKESFKSLIKHVLKVVKSKLPKNEGEGGIIPGLIAASVLRQLVPGMLGSGQGGFMGLFKPILSMLGAGKGGFLRDMLDPMGFLALKDTISEFSGMRGKGRIMNPLEFCDMAGCKIKARPFMKKDIKAKGGFLGYLYPLMMANKVVRQMGIKPASLVGKGQKGGRLTNMYKRFLTTYLYELREQIDDKDPDFNIAARDLAQYQRDNIEQHLAALTQTYEKMHKKQLLIDPNQYKDLGGDSHELNYLQDYANSLLRKLEQSNDLDEKALLEITPLFPADLLNNQSYVVFLNSLEKNPQLYGVQQSAELARDIREQTQALQHEIGIKSALGSTPEDENMKRAMSKYQDKLKVQMGLAEEPLTTSIFDKPVKVGDKKKLKPLSEEDLKRLTKGESLASQIKLTTDDKERVKRTSKSKKMKTMIVYRIFRRNQENVEDSVHVDITPPRIEELTDLIGQVYRMGATPVPGITSKHDRSSYMKLRNVIRVGGADVTRASAIEITSVDI